MEVRGQAGNDAKQQRRKKAGTSFYRSAKQTLSSRIRKKLTEKTSWYKKRKNDENSEQKQKFEGTYASKENAKNSADNEPPRNPETSRQDHDRQGGRNKKRKRGEEREEEETLSKQKIQENFEGTHAVVENKQKKIQGGKVQKKKQNKKGNI